jgi:hypothetical protein
VRYPTGICLCEGVGVGVVGVGEPASGRGFNTAPPPGMQRECDSHDRDIRWNSDSNESFGSRIFFC